MTVAITCVIINYFRGCLSVVCVCVCVRVCVTVCFFNAMNINKKNVISYIVCFNFPIFQLTIVLWRYNVTLHFMYLLVPEMRLLPCVVFFVFF